MPTTDSNKNDRQEGDRKAVLLKALNAIDSLQSKLDAVERERSEPIAIVGLACRFPGSKDPDEYWRLLSKGLDAVREVPPERWDKRRYYDPDPAAPGKMHAPYGGFLDQVDLFDAAFFGISGREAESMDPQQRLLLEVTWEALENAGIAATGLRGSATGVYVGISSSDYAHLAMSNSSAGMDVYAATGGAHSVAAGRLSYILGLNGPAMAVDTACSSSLVAVHLACQSLRQHECNLALAGGVNLLLAPEPFVCLSKWGMMALDGRCKTFDERADGFVRGEGCGMIALKRLSEALKTGDRVLALIRGTAINQDGASSGLTVPNGLAQQELIRAALKSARLQPHDVDYIEAHGTGTSLGDPIELEAMAAVLGKNRSPDRPLRVASVKTNLGHLESASGIASLIKVVLSLGHQQIPRQLHFHKLNPHISLDGAPIEIPIETLAWPRSERARVAGVSSFGFSGTNAHVIIEEAPTPRKVVDTASFPDRSTHLLILSATSESALRDLSLAYAEDFSKENGFALADICHTAAIGRSELSHRLAFPSGSIAEAKELLKGFAEGKQKRQIVSGRVRPDSRVAFLFSGQGGPLQAAGRDLYRVEPVFRKAFDQCGVLLGDFLDRPWQDIAGYTIDGCLPSSLVEEPRYAQPALFSLEYALASLWRSWGIEPAAIVGHGLGEYAAACVAGALSLKDALCLVATKARLLQTLPRTGAMAAVCTGEDQVRAALARGRNSVSITAVNSPLSTVISGNAEDLSAVLERLRGEGVEWQRLTGAHAFHSTLIDPILDEFEQYAQGIKYCAPALELVLSTSGDSPSQKRLPVDANYWRRQARETIRFADSIRSLYARGIRSFLEIGPAGDLIEMGQQSLKGAECTWMASLVQDREDLSQMLSSLGTLFVLGAKPDWSAYDRPHRRRRVTLPTYTFQRARHWLPAVPESPAPLARQSDTTIHPLLGRYVPIAARPGEHLWSGVVSGGLPNTAGLEMAIAAAVEAGGQFPIILTPMEIENPLVFGPETEFEIQTRLECRDGGTAVFQIYSRKKDTNEAWTRHTSATLRTGGSGLPEEKFDIAQREAFEKRSTRFVDGSDLDRLHKAWGGEWGPRFQRTSRAWQGQGEALSEIKIALDLQGPFSRYILTPAFADSLEPILTATIQRESSGESIGKTLVARGCEELRVYRRPIGECFYAHTRLRSHDAQQFENNLVGDVRVFDSSGSLIIETIGVRLGHLDSTQKLDISESVDDWLYEPRWVIKESSNSDDEGSVAGTWIVLRDKQGTGDALRNQLRERGGTCICVDYGEQYSALNGGTMTIRPDQAEDYDELFRAVPGCASTRNRIIHLWSLDAADPDKAALADVQKAEMLGPVSVLQIVKALDRAPQLASPQLWLVTCGAQPVAEKPACLSFLQSPLWGLGRTIAIESAGIWGGQIDLDPDNPPIIGAGLLLRELVASKDEDQMAFRDGHRFVLRLARRAKTISRSNRISIRPNAAYLVTGGLGGIGLIIAGWLVARGARNLILAGRTSLPGREHWNGVAKGTAEAIRIAAIRRLEAMGANIRMAVVDMGDENSVSELVKQCLCEQEPPLRGVFHAAGIVRNELLATQNSPEMLEIFSSKMVGGWLLDRLLADVPLELFVLFSSFSALLTLPTQGSYSAANVFLDALAHRRRAKGQVALSVNWGPWAEAGMAARFVAEASKHDGRAGASSGVTLLATGHALAALERLLECDAVQAGVIQIDWDKWHRWSYRNLPVTPYLSLLGLERSFGTPGKIADGESRKHILAARSETREEIVVSYLAEQVARILRVPLGSVDTEKSIVSMGFDSLMSIELKNQMEGDLGVSVAMARLIQGPTLLELSNWVLRLLTAAEQDDSASMIVPPIEEYEEGVL